MEPKTIYTIDELREILTNLDNGISCGQQNMGKLKRVKLPIPEEYGGGIVTGFGYENAVRNLIERVKDQLKADMDGPTFSECYEQWISIKMGEKRSPSTIANYKWMSSKYLLPFFGDIRIADITPDHIQRFYNSVNSLSESISTQCKAILCGIFDRAVRMGQVDKNIMLYKYERSRKKGDKVVLQDEDLVNVMKDLGKLKGNDYFYACFLCFSPLRRGEILGLKWEDLDFPKLMLTVNRNVTYPVGSNDPVVKAPKYGSFGVAYLHSELLERLEPYKSLKGYIISRSQSDSERPISRSSFMKMWKRIKKTLDLKGATSHSFRASYATMINAVCDCDPKVLQGILRHKTPDLAIRVYAQKNRPKIEKAEKEYDQWINSQLKQTSK